MKQLLGRGLKVQWVPLPSGMDPADIGVDYMIELREMAVDITRVTMTAVLLQGLSEVD